MVQTESVCSAWLLKVPNHIVLLGGHLNLLMSMSMFRKESQGCGWFFFQETNVIDNKLATRAEVEKVAKENTMEADEAKKIVESITDSITSGEKQECEYN